MGISRPPKKTDGRFDDWLFLLWKELNRPAESTDSAVVDEGALDHNSLANLNTGAYRHLSYAQLSELTGGASTTLHRHPDSENDHSLLTNLNTEGYYHLSYPEYTDLTDGGETSLHKHDHATQNNLNSASYRHVTQTEYTDLMEATYVTVSGSPASLPNIRTFAVGTGLSKTDGGAGSTLTLNHIAFVGDSGTGGLIGAVPAPAAGDGDAALRKYLCADGLWRVIDTSGDVSHNNTTGIEGGVATGVFESTAFESTAFQQGVTEYFHVTEEQFNYLTGQTSILNTAVDATLTDDAYTCVVTATAKTITLPTAVPARYGREWTVIMNCTGYVDIEPDVSDTIIIPGGSDTIRLTQIGSNVTLRCVSATEWVIV
jgi:hypothetical protein